jgi:hypothetical protein
MDFHVLSFWTPVSFVVPIFYLGIFLFNLVAMLLVATGCLPIMEDL